MSTELIAYAVLYLKTNFCYLLPIIETFSIARQPNRPTIVVEGVNSTRVLLAWRFSLKTNESIRVIHFYRERSGEKATRIATKRGSRPFAFASEEFKVKYKAQSSSSLVTLQLLDVNNNEEYTYNARVVYSDGIRSHHTSWRTDVLVYGEYNCPNHFSPLYKILGAPYFKQKVVFIRRYPRAISSRKAVIISLNISLWFIGMHLC